MKRRDKAGVDSCCCGSGREYEKCCGRWHAGEAAPDAESLMRSRYAAFVRALPEYLMATWHPRTRPTSIDFDPKQKWLGLTVRDARSEGDTAEVEFIARFRIGGGSAERLHERSRFVRDAGRWLYVDGTNVSREP